MTKAPKPRGYYIEMYQLIETGLTKRMAEKKLKQLQKNSDGEVVYKINKW